jgi:hypothetical protein
LNWLWRRKRRKKLIFFHFLLVQVHRQQIVNNPKQK